MELSVLELVGRMTEAAGLGALIGLEREAAARGAGARTHALVAVGSAVFTLAGAYGFTDVASGGRSFDPSRIAAQVATGVGFIGAGAIVRSGLTVQGVTTASTVWLAAAVGVGVAAGGHVLAIAAVAVALIVLVGLHLAAPVIQRVARRRLVLEVTYERGSGTLGPLLRRIEQVDGRLEQLSIDDADDGVRRVRLFATVPHRVHVDEVVGDVAHQPEVRSVRVMPTE